MTMHNIHMSSRERRLTFGVGYEGDDFARGNKKPFPKLVERMEIGETAEKRHSYIRAEADMEIGDAYNLV